MRPYLLALCMVSCGAAQTVPRLVIDVGGWRASARGQIQSGLLPVDLQSDLAVRNSTRFFGTALIRISGRHRIVVQGSPLQFEGRNLLSRTITYNNRNYRVEDTVESKAELTYLFAGHQWDFLSRERGHLGLRTGAAYLDASGALASVSTGVSAARSYRVGVPLAGFSGEAFLAPRVLSVHGEIQGMPLGGYGYYVQGSAGVGIHAGPVGFRLSYRFIDADVHERGPAGTDRAGVAPRISGPVFSAVIRVP